MAMRTRDLKPGFFKNELLAQCSYEARFLFQGLWCLADREGRLEDRPARIRAEVLPYRDGDDIEPLLGQLVERGFIIRYEAQGKKLMAVVNFSSHQKPHPREMASALPAPRLGAPKARPRRAKKSSYSLSSSSSEPSIPSEPSLPSGEQPSVAAQRAADKPPQVAVARKVSAKPHPQAVAAFCDAWRERYGEKYLFNAGKDGSSVKAMLRHVDGDLDKFRATVDAFLSDESSFCVDVRHPLGLFRAQFSRWLVPAASGPPANQGVRAVVDWANDRNEAEGRKNGQG